LTNDNNNEQNQKLSQKQKDVIQFLHRLSEFKDNNKLSEYINEIGDFRFKRILPALNNLDIINAEQSVDGRFQVIIRHGFEGYSTQDIEGIIDAINNGEIDI
jgi:hypothetical protein